MRMWIGLSACEFHQVRVSVRGGLPLRGAHRHSHPAGSGDLP